MSRIGGSESWERLIAVQIRDRGRWYFQLAYRVTRDVEAAEDACQQSFCKAWEHRDQILSPDALSHWLSRTVLNHALQTLRRRRTEERVLKLRPTAASPAGPDEAVARKEAIWMAIDRLAEPVQTVVVLRLVQGLSGNEVKGMLGCSAAEVSRRLRAGVMQLRGELAETVEQTGA